MESQEIVKLSALAERLGWRLPACAGAHLIDLLVARTVVDLVAVLAEDRDALPVRTRAS
ncbi:hypothetical protein [Lentzea sp.]|uniref:hypothetical protein n=1 Tax=Lentzea sp. TaxID=56099 RepID=UPI002ED07253